MPTDARSTRSSFATPTRPNELRAAQDETLAAMRRGDDVIFQATFFDGRWRGHADFLVRRDDRPSDLGSWSYDVADTKLARRVKAAAIVQMCVYADLLEGLQGIPPETISVVTGDGTPNPHRLADYAAYYRAAKRRFEERVFATAPRGPARHVSRAGRPLPGLQLVDPVRPPAPRGRPPVARRGRRARPAAEARRGRRDDAPGAGRAAGGRGDPGSRTRGSSSGCAGRRRSSWSIGGRTNTATSSSRRTRRSPARGSRRFRHPARSTSSSTSRPTRGP